MGQKVNPIALRLGYIEDSHSRWFAKKGNFALYLQQDSAIRSWLEVAYKKANIEKTIIERKGKNIVITIHCVKPGVIIGKDGIEREKIKQYIHSLTNIVPLIQTKEVKNPRASAKLVAENICQQIEKRVMYKRVVKKVLQEIEKARVLGAKITISGRLGGAEIARSEQVKFGRVPLHTFRAKIDYCCTTALTTYGIIGVKVILYNGDSVKG